MNITNHACIPSALFTHPDFRTQGKRTTELSILAGLFTSGYQYMSIRHGVELVNKLTKHRTSKYHIQLALEELVENGWIGC